MPKIDQLVLEIQNRNPKENVRVLRRLGRVPAVIYGEGKSTIPVSFEHNLFIRILKKVGRNTILELKLPDEKAAQQALIHDIQYNPVDDTVSHVDFLRVSLEREVTAKVPVKTTGVAPAVKDFGGILVVDLRELHIRCKAKDLMREIVLDVSGLSSFSSSIRVKDVHLPPGVKLLHDPEMTVVTITTQQKEEEEAPKPVEGAVPAEGTATEAAPAEGAEKKPVEAKGKETLAAEKKEEKKK